MRDIGGILLYSGGMDSYIAWHFLGHPKTLYVDLGHVYRRKEREAIMDTIPDTKIISCEQVGLYEKDTAVIPLRNLLLVSFAVMEGADTVWLVIQKDEMSIPDRSDWFMSKAGELLSFLSERTGIQILSPFLTIDKTTMVASYLKSGGEVSDLLKTVGCYSSLDGHCGNCGACFRRYVAFRNNEIDPGYDLTGTVKQMYRDRLDTYSLERQRRMERWL